MLHVPIPRSSHLRSHLREEPGKRVLPSIRVMLSLPLVCACPATQGPTGDPVLVWDVFGGHVPVSEPVLTAVVTRMWVRVSKGSS